MDWILNSLSLRLRFLKSLHSYKKSEVQKKQRKKNNQSKAEGEKKKFRSDTNLNPTPDLLEFL